MTARHDLDPTVLAWFQEGPSAMPDRVIDVVGERIARQGQRRTWRLRGRPFMNVYAKAAAGLAAVILVAVAGWSLLPRTGGVGQPVPTPSPTVAPTPTTIASAAGPSPTAAVSQCQNGAPCEGLLGAGLHASTAFGPGLSFVSPAGWINSIDSPNVYELDPNVTGVYYVLFWSDARITAHTDTCEPAPIAGLGTKPNDWTTYLKTLPGLVIGGPTTVKFGGYSGTMMLTTVKPGWTKGCPNFSFPSVQFLAYQDPVIGSGTYGAASGQRLRNYFVDVAGKTVVIQIYSLDSDAVDPPAMAALLPVLESIRFRP